MSDVNQGPELVSNPAPAAGLSENVAAALAYITIIPAILFLVLEPYNRSALIRFHAFQNIGLCVAWILSGILMVIPIIGWVISPILFLVLIVGWVLCIYNAYQGKLFKLPVLGNIVEGIAANK
ncbi:MAG TPA: hypothetical protein VGC07_00815 [Granulicella sp.]